MKKNLKLIGWLQLNHTQSKPGSLHSSICINIQNLKTSSCSTTFGDFSSVAIFKFIYLATRITMWPRRHNNEFSQRSSSICQLRKDGKLLLFFFSQNWAGTKYPDLIGCKGKIIFFFCVLGREYFLWNFGFICIELRGQRHGWYVSLLSSAVCFDKLANLLSFRQVS